MDAEAEYKIPSDQPENDPFLDMSLTNSMILFIYGRESDSFIADSYVFNMIYLHDAP